MVSGLRIYSHHTSYPMAPFPNWQFLLIPEGADNADPILVATARKTRHGKTKYLIGVRGCIDCEILAIQ